MIFECVPFTITSEKIISPVISYDPYTRLLSIDMNREG
jgi:hypothetical protein